MPRCPSCDNLLPDDRNQVGARCPNCKDPLYEPPGRVGRPAREGEGQCPVHPGVETVGTCRRCGNYLCEVCRTRWRAYMLCAACVQRALDAKEAAPELDSAHRRQALLSLFLGVGLWAVLILAFLVAMVLAAASQGGPGPLAVLAGLIILGAAGVASIMSIFGIGSGASALRPRGPHMLLATGGLLLSCLFLGGMIGFITFIIYVAAT
jgi:hypothetical protein